MSKKKNVTEAQHEAYLNERMRRKREGRGFIFLALLTGTYTVWSLVQFISIPEYSRMAFPETILLNYLVSLLGFTVLTGFFIYTAYEHRKVDAVKIDEFDKDGNKKE